jgi:hypothetical protein
VFVADSVIHVCVGRLVALQVVDVAFDMRFSMFSGARGKPAKNREFSAVWHLRGSPPIPMPARQIAALGASGRRFSGGVMVYLAQKTTVYRQVYRHTTVVLVGFGETAVDSHLAKNRVISTAYSHPETH